MKVISDASTLIGLARIGQLNLLRKLYSQIIIPQAVFEEVSKEKKAGSEKISKASYIKIEKVKDEIAVKFLLGNLGKGESEVLVLAKEKQADLILIDEKKARKMARRAGFKVMGILGLLLVSKRNGFISNIKAFIDELNKQGFRLSNRVIKEILKEAGEL